MRRAAAALAVVLASSGCDVEFIQPGQDPRASLGVTLDVLDADAARLSVRAIFWPGLTPSGEPRRVPDDTLRVGALRLIPESPNTSEPRRYFHVVSYASGDAPTRVAVVAPLVEGTAGAPPQVEVNLPWRVGPRRLTLSSGEDLRLIHTGLGADAGERNGARWWVTVTAPNTQVPLVRLSSEGIPPDTIEIPAAWITRGEWSELRVELVVIDRVAGGDASGDYLAQVSIHSGLDWLVTYSGS